MTALNQTICILKVTFLALVRNWSSVLRAVAVPMVLPIVVLVAWVWWAFDSGYVLRYFPDHAGGGGMFPVFAIVLALMAFLGTLPVAVAWHRFDLRGEKPGTLWPRFSISYSINYLARSILLVLVAIVAALVLLLPAAIFVERGPDGFNLMAGTLPDPPTPRNFVVAATYASLLSAYLLRLSLILPAGAVGRNMSMGESKAASKAKLGFGVFLLLGLFMHLAPIGLDALLAEMALTDVMSILIVPFVLLFRFMFGIALLTALYGHCVEDRPLA